MKRAAVALVLALAACAPVETAPTPSPPPRAALALHQDAAVPAAIDAAFKAEIAGRYDVNTGRDTISNDLAAAGFLCRDLGAYPQVQARGVVAVCELPKPHGLCSDKWTVELKLKPLTSKIAFERIAPEGRFERTCVSGASPDG